MFKRISTTLTLASMVNVVFATSPPNYYQVTEYENANCTTKISNYLVEFGATPQGAQYLATCASPVTDSTWTLAEGTYTSKSGTGNQCVNMNSQYFIIDCGGGAYNNSASHAAIDTSAFTIQIQESCSPYFAASTKNGQNVTLPGSQMIASFTCDSQSTTSAWTGTASFAGAATYDGGVSNQCSGTMLVNCAYSAAKSSTSNTPTTSASGAGSTSTNSASSNTGLKQTTLVLSFVIALLAAI